MIGEEFEVITAIAAAGKTHGEDIQPKVQAPVQFPVATRCSRSALVAAITGHVRSDRFVSTHTLELLFLKNPQQLDLSQERHVADFIKEDRAAVALLELANPSPFRTRERTFLVPAIRN